MSILESASWNQPVLMPWGNIIVTTCWPRNHNWWKIFSNTFLFQVATVTKSMGKIFLERRLEWWQWYVEENFTAPQTRTNASWEWTWSVLDFFIRPCKVRNIAWFIMKFFSAKQFLVFSRLLQSRILDVQSRNVNNYIVWSLTSWQNLRSIWFLKEISLDSKCPS